MADTFIYMIKIMIHKITSSVEYNYWLKRLETQLNETVKSLKVPKVF